MAIDLQQVINSRLSLRLVSLLARAVPTALGYPLAGLVGTRLARRRRSSLVRAVRVNQWVARGRRLDGEALDRAVETTLQHSARSIFELYHFLPDIQAVRRLIVLDEPTKQLFSRREFGERGLLVAGLHLSNFDLILQWMCEAGMHAMALTLPDLEGARRIEYERRRKSGMLLVPATFSGMRDAVRYLQQGGLVVTGIDRPIPDPPARPRFFGQPSALPLHYAYLALKAHVPVQLMAPVLSSDGCYHIASSKLIEMEPGPDRAAALRNAETVLTIAEDLLRSVPEQWAVPLPVWPDLLPLVPD